MQLHAGFLSETCWLQHPIFSLFASPLSLCSFCVWVFLWIRLRGQIARKTEPQSPQHRTQGGRTQRQHRGVDLGWRAHRVLGSQVRSRESQVRFVCVRFGKDWKCGHRVPYFVLRFCCVVFIALRCFVSSCRSCLASLRFREGFGLLISGWCYFEPSVRNFHVRAIFSSLGASVTSRMPRPAAVDVRPVQSPRRSPSSVPWCSSTRLVGKLQYQEKRDNRSPCVWRCTIIWILLHYFLTCVMLDLRYSAYRDVRLLSCQQAVAVLLLVRSCKCSTWPARGAYVSSRAQSRFCKDINY